MNAKINPIIETAATGANMTKAQIERINERAIAEDGLSITMEEI